MKSGWSKQKRIRIRCLDKTLGRTLIYVTHDKVEALSLADRVAILHEGRLQQVGRPERLYNLPANRSVAELISSLPMNLIPAQLRTEDSLMRLTGTGFALDAPHGLPETTVERNSGRQPRAASFSRRSLDRSSRLPEMRKSLPL
jgi:ABC-type sugar transport system ATPase subunit